MNVELTETAREQFKKLPKPEAKKVARKLLRLQHDPYSGKKLEGKLKDRYSLRAWPYRIIYVFSSRTIIQVEVIEHRKGAYK